MAGDVTPREIAGYAQILVLLAAALLVFNIVIGPALSGATGPERSVDEQVILYPDGSGELSTDGEVRNFSATQSLGDAVAFTGANDSELTGQASLAVSGNWTVTTWARRDPNATGDRRVLQLDGWLYLTHNESAQQWRVTYYDESDLQVYSVTAAAPSPETWTLLAIERNATALSVARNNTTVATVPIDGVGGGAVRNASNWDGTVEETRVINETLTPTQRGRIYRTPTAPLSTDDSARIYYDAYAGESTIDVYYTGSDLTLSNASVVAGFDGQPLVEDDPLDLTTDDYVRDGTTIATTGDGNLTGAPVVFASYDTGGEGGGVSGANALLGLVLIAAALAIIQNVIPE